MRMGLSAIDRSYERLVARGRVGIRYRPGTTQPELWSAGEGAPPYKENTVSEQQPSVGRVVHFSEDGETCLAATIAFVHDNGTINLGYLSEAGGQRQAQHVEGSPGPSPHRWHWPERV